MSRQHIAAYRRRITGLRARSGSDNEGVVSQAFGRLLEDMGRARDLILIQQYERQGARGPIRIDGALAPAGFRVPFGYWEAKDQKDNLNREIENKRRAGYPDSNIIYEDTREAVLIQDGKPVDRAPLQGDDAPLLALLDRFFAYQSQEQAEFRKAAAQFRADLPDILKALREALTEAETNNAAYRSEAELFLGHARAAIHQNVSADDVREMLIQHILTEAIFTRVFDDAGFHRENNVARALQRLENLFLVGDLRRRTVARLGIYYGAITAAAAQLPSRGEKQAFLKTLYEDFYKVYNPKAADRLGVVYTPAEIVRFMIRGAEWLTEKHWGKVLSDPGVEILDPAAGTGTFIVELLEHIKGDAEKLRHKYKEELHANEVAILPYYVANLNIEATYAAITGHYAEFENLCFVDTLDNTAGLGIYAGHQGDLLGGLSDENIGRIKRQNERRISVIIGNPPYNANQRSENDNNKNRAYSRVDERLRATYVRLSKATKPKVFDPYARFYRWATDRLICDGVIAFITNRSFLTAKSYDGFRLSICSDFAEIITIDLGGDYKDPGLAGQSNVFNIATGVAVAFLVKRRNKPSAKFVSYYAVPNVQAQEKLAWLSSVEIDALNFRPIKPSDNGNWLDALSPGWRDLLPLANKETKASIIVGQQNAIIQHFSMGTSTNRDDWVVR